jgi:hypothetical protein
MKVLSGLRNPIFKIKFFESLALQNLVIHTH